MNRVGDKLLKGASLTADDLYILSKAGYFDDVARIEKASGVAVGDINLMPKTENFYKNSLNRKIVDPDGYVDIIGHGTTRTIEVNINGKILEVDHRFLANYLENSSFYNGENIRLLSCNTGTLDTGFAQDLANKLNVQVIAPNNYIWAYPNGEMVIAPMLLNGQPDLSNIGNFIKFIPGN